MLHLGNGKIGEKIGHRYHIDIHFRNAKPAEIRLAQISKKTAFKEPAQSNSLLLQSKSLRKTILNILQPLLTLFKCAPEAPEKRKNISLN